MMYVDESMDVSDRTSPSPTTADVHDGAVANVHVAATNSSGTSDQQPMDISDIDSRITNASAAAGGSGISGATTDNTSFHLKSIEKMSNSETNSDAASLIHEHHHTPSGDNSSSADVSTPYDAGNAPCKSIEEASISTTIEVTMQDIEEIDNSSPDGMKQQYWNIPQPQSVGDNGNLVETVQGNASSSDGEDIFMPTEDTSNHKKVLIRLTPQEEELFQLLVNAAEAHERGELTIDPNPPQQSVSARGGFTKQESLPEGADGSSGVSWLDPPPKVDRIEIRVAGGWVRDKLLNQHSSDVDVALDCMMGVQFARIVQSFLALQSVQNKEDEMNQVADDSMGGEDGDGVNKDGKHQKQKKKQKTQNKLPKVGVIGANPSQSKHLETATMNIHGIDVDFVNLRAEEVYEANSRIPTSDTRNFGSPLEDALRRDFTINSLFYNIRTRKIEDWTGRGLVDLLEHRKIVTPVDAHETFHDDPLRVLRAIRFCVRLDFVLDEQLKSAAMSKRVHHSLHVKVSRERVGKELEGMLTGKGARPGCALDTIADLHLAGSVFCFPGSFPGDHDYQAGGPVTGNIMGIKYHGCLGKDGPEAVELATKHRAMGWNESSALIALLPQVVESYYSEREIIAREKSEASDGMKDSCTLSSTVDARLLHLCVFILPFHNLSFPDSKGRETSVASHMIKESLKFPTRDIQAVTTILRHVDEMSELLSGIRTQLMAQQKQEVEGGTPIKLPPPCRLRAGLLLRSLKEHWVTCLLTAASLEIRSVERLNKQYEDEVNGTIDATTNGIGGIPVERPSLELYRAVVSDLDLDECWRVRPHLNGKEIIKELSLPKGPAVGVYIDDQIQWMLLNPNGTREECMSHLQERKREREQECDNTAEGENVGDQNEVTMGVSNSDGNPSPVSGSTGCEEAIKHYSKKIRSDNMVTD